MAPSNWVEQALCRKRLIPDAWFPEEGHASKEDPITSRVYEACAACPVRAECEEAGIPEKHGIWGGVYRSEAKMENDLQKQKKKRDEVPFLGPQRRLQALAALGWTGKDVATDIRRYTGLTINPKTLDLLCNEGKLPVPREIAVAIDRAFHHLANVSATGIKANEIVAHARLHGWPTPRQWRGYNIDDPEVRPDAG